MRGHVSGREMIWDDLSSPGLDMARALVREIDGYYVSVMGRVLRQHLPDSLAGKPGTEIRSGPTSGST